MVTEWDFLQMEASLWLKEKSWVLLKVGCLPYVVGKQPSISLINLGRKWTLSWWWWWIRYSWSKKSESSYVHDHIQPLFYFCNLTVGDIQGYVEGLPMGRTFKPSVEEMDFFKINDDDDFNHCCCYQITKNLNGTAHEPDKLIHILPGLSLWINHLYSIARDASHHVKEMVCKALYAGTI